MELLSKESGRLDSSVSQATKSFVKYEVQPGDRHDHEFDALIGDTAMAMHHPTSTANMGQDDVAPSHVTQEK